MKRQESIRVSNTVVAVIDRSHGYIVELSDAATGEPVSWLTVSADIIAAAVAALNGTLRGEREDAR